jgi:hypothetical protein
MTEKRTIQTVQRSITTFFRENRRMPSFAEMACLVSKRSLLGRFEHFIESTDWEERYLCNHWIDKICLCGIFISMIYFIHF